MPSPPDRGQRVDGCEGPDCLERVHAACEALWRDVPDVDGTDRLLFETAVVELVGNAVEHAPGPGGSTVLLGASADALWVEVRAPGPPVEVDLDAPLPPDDAPSGRGIPLVRRTTDTLTLTREQDVNVWRAVRALTAPRRFAGGGPAQVP